MLESTSRLIRVYEHASGASAAYTIPGALFSEEEYRSLLEKDEMD